MILNKVDPDRSLTDLSGKSISEFLSQSKVIIKTPEIYTMPKAQIFLTKYPSQILLVQFSELIQDCVKNSPLYTIMFLESS